MSGLNNNNNMELRIEDLYRDYWKKMLLQVCLRYTKNIEQAEDWCQNGFIKINNNLDKYTDTGSLEGWVRRIIRNTVMDDLRKKKLEVTYEGYDDVVEEIIEESEKYTFLHIMKVKEKLSPTYKKVFDLHVLEQLKHKEIAQKLNITEGTSKSNFHKAKKSIKRMLLTSKNL